jgi:flagellar assembly factor FliW
MEIKTRDFGIINAEEEDIIEFTSGLYGFEEYKKYVILKDNPDDNIMYLQCAENGDLSFVLIDPYSIFHDYEPSMVHEDLEELNVKSENELRFLVIAIIRKKIKDSVVNLKSPIAINPQLKTAKQSILQNLEYPLRYPILCVEGERKC